MPFPSTLSSFNRPTATDRLNSPSHSALHNTVSSALGQVEAVIGVEGDSSVVGTLEYFIKSPASDGGGHVQAANKGGTGQTSFNKGDILVATSSSVLTKLAVGTVDGYALIVDSSVAAGVKWGLGAPVPSIGVYSTSSTFTLAIPSNISYMVVEVQGGGGSGAGGGATDWQSGSGGGAGGYAKKRYLASALGTSQPVSVAAAGALSSFGTGATSIVGGAGGNGTAGTGYTTGGVGGTASGGDINAPGGTGFSNIFRAAAEKYGGQGADSRFGGGGLPQFSQSAGNAATGNGAGGGGGTGQAGNPNAAGAGSAGIVIITSY